MGFKCSGCGCCCKRINIAVENTKHIEELYFPYSWDEDGRCEMLMEDNRCKVYEDRPLLCNVEKIAEHLNLDKEQFYIDNNKACNKMMDEMNVDLSFRV